MAGALREIPLFPLESVVLFPGVHAPLHIFEPRYRQMMEVALAGDRTLGMVAVPPDRQGGMAGSPALYDVGCAGFIGRHERLADGRYHLILEGTERFRIVEERAPEGDRLFRVAEVEALEEDPSGVGSGSLGESRRVVLGLLESILGRAGRGARRRAGHRAGHRAGDGADDRARSAVERLEPLDDVSFVNSLCISLGLACEDKQALLEACGPRERLERMAGVLEFHLARMRTPAGDGSQRVH